MYHFIIMLKTLGRVGEAMGDIRNGRRGWGGEVPCGLVMQNPVPHDDTNV